MFPIVQVVEPEETLDYRETAFTVLIDSFSTV